MPTSPRYEKVFLILIVIIFSVVAFYAVSNNRRVATGVMPVKIGFISALGNVGDNSGEEELKAVQLAVDEINKNGGVDGRQIDLVAESIPAFDKKISTTTSEYRRFEARFKVRFGRLPHAPATIRAYDAVYRIVETMGK